MHRDRGDRRSDCKVYVGNLPPDIRSRDLEDLFYKYGKIVDVDFHSGRAGPPFAFIEFEDARDAEDAISGRDGYSFDGYRIKVELPRGSTKGRNDNRSHGHNDRPRGFQRGNKPRGYQLLVSGLPPTGSWQDLKDHFRQAGDVIFTDVYKDGTGTVEYSRHEHMRRALRDLDDSKFKSHENEEAYIRVKDPRDSRSPNRSPHRSSPNRSRSRSPRGRSPRGRSYSPRGRSRSPMPSRYSRRSRSRSHSRSRSRSN